MSHSFDFPFGLPYPMFWHWSQRLSEVFMGEFSPWHWLLVAAIALLLFGPKKLPELGKGLAEGIRSFKDGMKEQPPTQASTDSSKKPETKS